ncbi:hypothetical protein ASE23_00865 [Rhizobium sp. Root73]|uniref:hypothetical protein n=1 Tax=unclassified Rhizobium TaxID=2613769 RepID=UPI000715A5BA|nr:MULTISPECIES: hypothetical protein [unclassified Rhizobium]KQV37237.1 hypothetical protein ASC96_03965 [Rhizobium sp. Root1204]KQY17250.1 hypothetical protein ASD36_00870 [Rhizobium sp. Root1334]KRC13136.1 hypothetical protein ASE23_00865 [Rhizobium sp. Root73]
MKVIALLLAGAVLTAPEDKPAISDYFGNNGTTSQPAITQCNLTSDDLNGQFKTCRYDCGKTLTIGACLVCPFVLQR